MKFRTECPESWQVCLACGNDVVSGFTVGEWDDDEG